MHACQNEKSSIGPIGDEISNRKHLALLMKDPHHRATLFESTPVTVFMSFGFIPTRVNS